MEKQNMIETLQERIITDLIQAQGKLPYIVIYTMDSKTLKLEQVSEFSLSGDTLIIGYTSASTGKKCVGVFDSSLLLGVSYAV